MTHLEEYMTRLALRPKSEIVIDWGKPVEVEPVEPEDDFETRDWEDWP